MNKIASAREIINIYLDDLYHTEEELQKELTHYLSMARSANLKGEIEDYIESILPKKEKLQQIYSHLNLQIRPYNCKILRSIIEETKEMANSTPIANLRDTTLLAGIQSVTNYKIGRYRILFELGTQLELHYPLSLLATIRVMEENTREVLSWLANNQVFKKAGELDNLEIRPTLFKTLNA